MPAPLYLDDDLLIVDKPAGLLAVPGRGPAKADCLAARVQAAFPGALVVHRLDMATSGLMLFARHPAAQRALSIAFAERRVHKRYVAVVAGRLEGAGEIDLPLIVDWPNRPCSRVDFEHGKPSLTRWRALASDGDTTRVELEPVTGRSHQLRLHLRELGHPILGDDLYAPPAWRTRAPRLLLHAAELALTHPVSNAPLAQRSPPPF